MQLPICISSNRCKGIASHHMSTCQVTEVHHPYPCTITTSNHKTPHRSHQKQTKLNQTHPPLPPSPHPPLSGRPQVSEADSDDVRLRRDLCGCTRSDPLPFEREGGGVGGEGRIHGLMLRGTHHHQRADRNVRVGKSHHGMASRVCQSEGPKYCFFCFVLFIFWFIYFFNISTCLSFPFAFLSFLFIVPVSPSSFIFLVVPPRNSFPSPHPLPTSPPSPLLPSLWLATTARWSGRPP